MPISKVSVIIPTYNRGHCLRDAIDSVLAQSFQDFELIIVDDGSTDNTFEIVEAYGANVKFIQQINKGAAAARNTGIRSARGKWVAFLDSDDLWMPDKLKVQLEDLSSNPTAVAHMVDVAISCEHESYPSLFEIRRLSAEFRQQPFRLRPLCDVLRAQFFTSSWMVRRDILEIAGYFNPALKIFEDIDLLTRIALEGPFVVSSYCGTKMRRRRRGTYALSDLYQIERLQSLQNLVHSYDYLKRQFHLSTKERRLVCRYLSGARGELAVQHFKQHQHRAAYLTLFRSVIDDPGLRSFFRATLILTSTKDLYDKIKGSHKKNRALRRSEMELSDSDKKITI